MNRTARIFLSVVSFVLVLLWRFPYYGNDSQPPETFNVFNQQISNESQFVALASAFLAALFVWFVTGFFKKRD